MYLVKECFCTLQGEGARAGSKAVFLRFAGCNLWNGLPEGRASGKGSCARWCDTDFVGGEKLSIDDILRRLDDAWPNRLTATGQRVVVLTGGEPFLQVDASLLRALRGNGWYICVETNGTLDPREDRVRLVDACDWVTVSPKVGSEVVCREAQELKVVLPGGAPGWTDAQLDALVLRGRYGSLVVQPQDIVKPTTVGQTYLKGDVRDGKMDHLSSVQRCIDFVMRYPEWRLGVQVHKLTGLP